MQDPPFSDYSIAGIFASTPSSTGWFAPKHLMEGDGAMRQLQIKKIVKRDPARNDPLPLDPRDADVLRAKQRLYEREARATRSDR
jgi:hypothetical protein